MNQYDRLMNQMNEHHQVVMGIPAYVRNGAVNAGEISINFNESYREIDNKTGQIRSTGPGGTVSVSDLQKYNINNNTILTINGTDYTVHKKEPDSTGDVVLLLTRVKCP